MDPEEICEENFVVLQKCRGYEAMLEAICSRAEQKLQRLEQRRREELPLRMLSVGLQCGGSDAFSGMTGNPAVGYAADMLVRAGATVMFSENSEVRDGAQQLAARITDEETCRRLREELAWCDRYLEEGGVDRTANPTPGNKAGGLSNIVEKAMGSNRKIRHLPHRGGDWDRGAAQPAWHDLRGNTGQRHDLRNVPDGLGDRGPGVYYRPGNAV